MKNNHDSSQKESFYEKICFNVPIICIIIPALIVSGFMPKWNVLPFYTWLIIAIIGGGLGGVLHTERFYLGLISGSITGAGALLGVKYYVLILNLFIDNHTYFDLEILLGAAIGAIPGIVIYNFYPKAKTITTEQK